MNRGIIAISSGLGWESIITPMARLLADSGYGTEIIESESEASDFEKALKNGTFRAVLDLVTADLLHSRKGPNRLTTAAIHALPQIISVGGLDFNTEHNSEATPEDMDRIGKDLVEKACAARGPTRIVIPRNGLSNRPQNPALNEALFQTVRNRVYPPEMLVEVDTSIQEGEFAKTAVNLLITLIAESETAK
ncbi:MAG: Tm-1-like ATP-binding domain-containing protein [Gemmataceae bacterium]